MRRVVFAALASVALVTGCTEKVATYCDGTHGCSDPALPRCDFATRTCMPADDAGASGDAATDASQHDATVDGSDDAATDGGGADASCGSSAECSEPSTPICGGGGCRSCQNGTECAARSTATPACHPDGRCVECRAHTDCAAKIDTPACELATSTCVACTQDEQCSYFCDRSTGRCAVDADVIFVDRSGASCGSGTGSGTLADPYCQIQTAVTNIATAKYIYVRPGSYDAVQAGVSFRLRAEPGAEVTAPSGSAFSVGNGAAVEVEGLNARLEGYLVRSSARLTLRRLRVSGAGGAGVICTFGGQIVVDRVEVVWNPGGGMSLDACKYAVTNTIIAHNSGGSLLGGVLLDGTQPGSVFTNNTIVSNTVATPNVGGVDCFAAASIVNSVIRENSPSQVGSNCVVAYSNVQGGATGTGNIDLTPSFVDAGTDNYRYNAGSPGIDVATAIGAPDHDFDGYPRPYNGTPDMGAFEWHP
jgi:hypothetical protein